MSKTFDLKAFRKDFNLNQIDVAFLFECTQPNIAAIEKGLRPLTAKQANALEEKYGDISRYYISDNITTEPNNDSISEEELNLKWEHLVREHLEHIKKLTSLLEESQNENKKLIDTINMLTSLMADKKAV